MPTLDLAMELGGEGLPGLPLGPRGMPLGGGGPFMTFNDPLETGGVAVADRLYGDAAPYGESAGLRE